MLGDAEPRPARGGPDLDRRQRHRNLAIVYEHRIGVDEPLFGKDVEIDGVEGRYDSALPAALGDFAAARPYIHFALDRRPFVASGEPARLRRGVREGAVD